MYPLTSNNMAQFLKNGRHQTVEIVFNGQEESLKITEADIVQGGLTIDRYCVSGKKIEVGSAIAAEMTLILSNPDIQIPVEGSPGETVTGKKFDNVLFEGAELQVLLCIESQAGDEGVESIPLGCFTVDETPRKLSSITLSALDRMVHFDKPYDSQLAYPASILDILSDACYRCNIQAAETLISPNSDLPNKDFMVQQRPDDDDLTYRQILQWIAEITGTCAYIDWNGDLRLEWYSKPAYF